MKPFSQYDRERFRKRSALFLALVLAVFAVVQVAHAHDGLASDEGSGSAATHCSICVAAHSAPQVTTISFAPILAFSATVAPVQDPQLESQLAVPSSFIRPPPSL